VYTVAPLLFKRAIIENSHVRVDCFGEKEVNPTMIQQKNRHTYLLTLLERCPELTNNMELSSDDVIKIVKIEGDVIIRKLCDLGCEIYDICPKFVEHILSQRKTTPLKFLKEAKDASDDYVKSAIDIYLHKSKKGPYEAIDKVGNHVLELSFAAILMEKVK
jgi:hypothetical protein